MLRPLNWAKHFTLTMLPIQGLTSLFNVIFYNTIILSGLLPTKPVH